MKTGVIIASTAVVVGVGAVAYYFLTRQPSVDPSQSNLLSNSSGSPASGSSTNVLDILNQLKTYLPTSSGKSSTSYEGKLIRIAKGKVYMVIDGLLRYVPKLKTPWPPVDELPSIPDGLGVGPDLTVEYLQSIGLAGVDDMKLSSRLLS